MKKLLKGLGYLLFTMCFSIAFVAISLLVTNKVIERKELSTLKGGLEIADAGAYEEEWKSTPSDIAGMSKWDKYEAGLAVVSGSDTDGDGLTDKDEIEIYKSDPLKVSTAGDLYSDLQKANLGMDLQKFYAYEGKQSFPYNEVPEIQLEAVLPTDFNAVVTDCTGRSNDDAVLAEYDVYNYGGNLSIDMSGIESEKIAVFVSDGKDVKQYSYISKEDIITLKNKFEADKSYTVYVMEGGFANSLSVRFGSMLPEGLITEKEVTGEGLVVDFPIITVFAGRPIEIYYEKLSSEQKTKELKEKVIKHTKSIMGDYDQFFHEDKMFATNKLEIKLRYEILKELLPFCDITYVENNKWNFPHLLFCYFSYSDKATFDEQKESEQIAANTTSGFNYFADTFPFGNFKSEYGAIGNCAGFSHLTAYLYNNGYYEDSGRYKTEAEIISWNIGRDSGNATLMDRKLADYKTASFVTDNSEDGKIIMDMLSSGEKEFVNMLGAINAEGNDRANFIYNEVYGGKNSRPIYDYSLIEVMKKYLENGKILDVYFMMVDGTGHAVNIYGYEPDKQNPNVTWFHVYDCNFPQNDTGINTMSETGIKLRVEKRRKASGDGFTFAYDYFPLRTEAYGATSNSSISENSFMVVMDENWRILND